MTSQALLASAGQRDLDSCLSLISIVETTLEFSFSVLLISAKTTYAASPIYVQLGLPRDTIHWECGVQVFMKLAQTSVRL